MKDFALELLSFLNDEVIIFIISMVPLIELRGAIPIGILFGLAPLNVFLLTYFASLIPAPFIIIFIDKIFKFLDRFKFFNKLNQKIIRRTESKHSGKVENYGLLGLFIIVAIPLPGTGVWSGSLAASLFKFTFWKALIVIALGNLIAALAIMAISLGVINIF